jgi:type 1 glutamine amidotransferase
VLLTVDESTFKPGKHSMLDEHAMAWAQTVVDGRVVYCALGHDARSFETTEFQLLLEQAMRWTGKL